MCIFKQFLNKIESRKLKIAVVGDSLIDEYYAVRVNRISPEFPIPVLLSEDDKPISVVPGGAANVCYQMNYWNADVYLLTALTDCGIPALQNRNFNYEYSVNLNEWKMPRKKRFYDGDFPLDRWDVESKNVHKTRTKEWESARKCLLENFVKMVEEVSPDMVILSDYNKGIFIRGGENISQPIIKHCEKNNIPVIVDPKTLDSDLWQGCTIIKPNADWARAFCEKYNPYSISDSKWEDEMTTIANLLLAKEVVLTDSGNGVGFYDRINQIASFSHSHTLSKKRPIIRSVIGAGDCFCVFLVMARSLGFNINDSIQIAFNGASAYIEDKHNSPVTPYMFHKWFDPIDAKIVSLNTLIDIKNQLSNQKWVWTNGCFDILHAGHIKTFEEAKKLGDKLIVGLNTDESIKQLKGDSRPIHSYKYREKLLSHLQYVDFIVPIYEKTPESIINKLKPNCIIKGGDYKVEDISGHTIVGKENVHIIPLLSDLSTSNIINRIKNG